MEELTGDELLFFNGREGALPLYAALRRRILWACGPVEIQVKKTQISFVSRRLFAAASFLPVRRAGARPDPYITVTFGLGRRLDSPRIHGAVEPYPGRWTHHVLLGKTGQIDGELTGWLQEAAGFAREK